MSSPPAWTMGTGRKSSNSPSVTVPGPGTYTVEPYQTSPSWKIGTSQRQKGNSTANPGPGTYDSPTRHSKTPPTYSFGLKTSQSEPRFTPGPGAYNQDLLRGTDKTAPSFTMRVKTPWFKADGTSPGPGAYDQGSRALNSRSATFKIGTAKRRSLHEAEDVPGPGTYISNVAAPMKTVEGPVWSFGTSVRGGSVSASNFQPGPGAYNSTYTGEWNPGTTMTSRRPDTAVVRSSRLPGPGAYDPTNFTKKRAPSFRLGSAARSIDYRSQSCTPGPGEYQPTAVPRKGKMRIGSSVRKPLSERVTTPGPGAYDYTLSTSHGPQYGMAPRRENPLQQQKDRSTPGPGAYTPEVEIVRKKFPKFVIGTASRDGQTRVQTVPGPGSYNTKKKFIGPKWGFGTESRIASRNSSATPGPGTYDIPEKFADVPRYAYYS